MKEVTKDMIIGDMLAQDMSIAASLMNAGMHCIGCPSSQGESLEEACMVHGLDADALAKKLNDFVESVEAKEA